MGGKKEKEERKEGRVNGDGREGGNRFVEIEKATLNNNNNRSYWEYQYGF